MKRMGCSSTTHLTTVSGERAVLLGWVQNTSLHLHENARFHSNWLVIMEGQEAHGDEPLTWIPIIEMWPSQASLRDAQKGSQETLQSFIGEDGS